jgi:hypothetical protein
MNKEQLEQWFKAMTDGFFGFLGFTAENTQTVAVAFVAGLLVLALVFGLIAKAVGRRRRKKEAKKQQAIDAAG